VPAIGLGSPKGTVDAWVISFTLLAAETAMRLAKGNFLKFFLNPIAELAQEHDPGCASNSKSAIKQHAESSDHNIHPRELSQEIIPGSWHSTLDSNTVNERKLLPGTYILLIYSEIMTAFSASNNDHHSSEEGVQNPQIEFY